MQSQMVAETTTTATTEPVSVPRVLTPDEIDDTIRDLELCLAQATELDKKKRALLDLLNAQHPKNPRSGTIHVVGDSFDLTLIRRFNITYKKLRGAPDPLFQLWQKFPWFRDLVTIRAEEKTAKLKEFLKNPKTAEQKTVAKKIRNLRIAKAAVSPVKIKQIKE